MGSLMELARRKKPAYGIYIGDTGVCAAEMAVYAGFDYIRLDCEHTLAELDSLKSMIRIADAAGVPTLVRISTISDVTRLLDFGASGLLFPDVSSKEQAQEAVRLSKYAPVGQRGMSNVSRKVKYGAVPFAGHLANANNDVCLMVQIESAEGVKNIDEILAVEGIDAVTVGAQDLSQSMGVAGQTNHPSVAEAQETVIRKTLEKGLYPLMTASSPEHSRALAEKGVYLQTICFDTTFIMKQFSRLLTSFREK